MKHYQRILVALAVSASHLAPYYSKAEPLEKNRTINIADRPISGKVTGDNEAPLANVNVVVKGTSTGTVTDAQGAPVSGGPWGAEAGALAAA